MFNPRDLFKRAHLQEVDFLLCQVAPASARQVLLGQSGEIHAVELRDVVAEALEDAAHDAVAARVDLDAGLVAVGLGCVGYGVGVDGARVGDLPGRCAPRMRL